MKRTIAAAVLIGVLIRPVVTVLGADISAKQVRQAIRLGVDYLKGQQRNDGSWRDYSPIAGITSQPGGLSALCTLALLNAGVGPEDKDIQRALGHLRKQKFKNTYAVALQTMVFCKAEPKRDLLLVSRNVKWLQSTQILTGPRKGAWSYPGANGDNSNSQFALLALHEAQRAGVAVKAQTWRLAKAYWEDAQHPDGSWGYYKGYPATGSMTCAGIASLIITTDKFQQSDARVVGGRIECCGRGEVKDDRIRRALQWLGHKDRFRVSGNPGTRGQTWLFYYLYGLERVGRLTNRRFIGAPGNQHDWYREGADWLVKQQDRLSGFWKGAGHGESDPLIGTSLALLFLAKGRRPVLLAKLKHVPAEDWNRHRGDVDNLTRFVESRWRIDLTWQTVDLRAATVEDLLQVPVIYLCGSLSPLPAAADQRRQLAGKLRDYLDRGGFLLAEGYCGGQGFDQGFRQLIKEIFPEPEYRLKAVPPEHPIWHAEQTVKKFRPLEAIEFGCRTSVIYAPADPQRLRPSLSCLWELSRAGRGQEFAPAVRAQIDNALAIGINVLAYATNRELKGKEAGFRIASDRRPADPVPRGRLRVARLRHPGGCNAAPRALVHLLETVSAELKIRTAAREKLLNITDDALFDYHLVFMHGRTRFRLTTAERERLKTFIERGGTLFADSICASRAFTDSFRQEMAEVFRDRKLEPIPVDDPLLTATYGGWDLRTVTRRDPQTRRDGGPLKAALHKVPPDLEGIKLDGRWGVIFSRFDVSCALEKHDSLECRGYTRQDAAKIGLNVVLYSLQQ